MSFGSFLLGLLMMVVGFFAVSKTNWFLENLGDIGTLFGSNKEWLSWKAVGLFLLFFGFLIAFGLLQGFFALTVGQFFSFGAVNVQ